jgi:hypothetical protein
MKEVQQITLKLADTAPMRIKVQRDTEEVVREAERNVNKVWSTWRREFPDKSSRDILAMTAYQFAKLYFQLQHTIESQEKLLSDFEGELDRLLQLTAEKDETQDINNSKNTASVN